MTDQSPDAPGDDPIDAAILGRLRKIAARLEPVPDDLTLAARSALAYRDLDTELARLVDTVDDKELAGVRSDAVATLLTFETEGGVIELEVSTDPDGAHVVGQCVPAGAQAVSAVQLHHDTVEFEVDDLGRFQGRVGRGPVRFVVRWPDGRQVAAEWVVV